MARDRRSTSQDREGSGAWTLVGAKVEVSTVEAMVSGSNPFGMVDRQKVGVLYAKTKRCQFPFAFALLGGVSGSAARPT